MSQDHQLSKEQREKLWMREQLNQIPEMRAAIDNLWQHIAFLARKAKITPKALVKETKDFTANYTFLKECVDEERKLQEPKPDPFAKVSEETKQAVAELIPEE
jgi:hypothetical protein